MAVTLSVAQLTAAIRLGDTDEEQGQAARLLALATQVVTKHAPDAPDVIHNESAIRVAGYLYDAPMAAGGAGYGDIIRNSGALSLLLPYRHHRAGSTAEAVAEAVSAGAPGNPVTGLSLIGTTLTVTFQDGAQTVLTLPAGGGLTEAEVVEIVDAAIAMLGGSDYVLPAAAPGVRGGVLAVTSAIIDTGTSTGVFGWAPSHVRRMIHSIVPAWGRTGNTDAIPYEKIAASFDGVLQDDPREINFLQQIGLDGALTGVGIAGNVLTVLRRTGAAVQLNLPAAAPAPATWARAGNDDVIPALKLPAPVGAAVTRYAIPFDASTYAFTSALNGGFDPGGSSLMTAAYPAGLTQAGALAALKTGYMVDDHQETPASPAGPMAELTDATMLSAQPTPTTPYSQVAFGATAIDLSLHGRELEDANQRDGWTLRLSLVG